MTDTERTLRAALEGLVEAYSVFVRDLPERMVKARAALAATAEPVKPEEGEMWVCPHEPECSLPGCPGPNSPAPRDAHLPSCYALPYPEGRSGECSCRIAAPQDADAIEAAERGDSFAAPRDAEREARHTKLHPGRHGEPSGSECAPWCSACAAERFRAEREAVIDTNSRAYRNGLEDGSVVSREALLAYGEKVLFAALKHERECLGDVDLVALLPVRK